MNAFEFARKFEKIDETVIRSIGVESVLENSNFVYDKNSGFVSGDADVFRDMFWANNSGLTFNGEQISKPFSDWVETGEFRENLHYATKNDIELESNGDGFEAIKEAFSKKDWIAPTAKILTPETKSNLRKSFIQKLKALWQTN
jgi:DNA topoisomerase VI subunit B